MSNASPGFATAPTLRESAAVPVPFVSVTIGPRVTLSLPSV